MIVTISLSNIVGVNHHKAQEGYSFKTGSYKFA